MTDGDRESELVDESLQFELPQAQAVAIASTTVGGDPKRSRVGIFGGAHLVPPRADCLHCKLRRVMTNPDADPRFVLLQVVHSIGCNLAVLLVHKIMHIDVFGVALSAQLAAAVFERPDKLL